MNRNVNEVNDNGQRDYCLDFQPNGMGAGVENIMAILTQMTQVMANNHNQMERPTSPHHGPSAVEKFMRQRPPSFIGSTDPLIAERWISSLEKIFVVVDCSEHEKVVLAVYRFEGEADQWWTLVKDTKNEDEIESMLWGDFKRIFLEKYFPRSVRSKMEKQFLELKQRDDESIAIYESNFTRLARYATGFVISPESKIDRFYNGLKPSLRKALAIREFGSYEEIVRCAEKVEMEFANSSWSHGAFEKKRKREHQSGGSSNKEHETKKVQHLSCPKCGKKHSGDCLQGTGRCFKCGRTGHQARECRQGQTNGPAGKQKVERKVFENP